MSALALVWLVYAVIFNSKPCLQLILSCGLTFWWIYKMPFLYS